jgi:hypothetical protein
MCISTVKAQTVKMIDLHHRYRPLARPGLGRALAALLLCAALAGCGITAPRHAEGFADLESLGARDADRTTTISIGPSLLRFAANHIDDDPETVQLLRSLNGVRIRIYEIDGDPARVSSRIKRLSAHLQADGWEPVLLVREQHEEVHMLLKMHAGSIRGMTVLTSDGEAEAAVINLMGDIQPARFSDVMLALDIDAPGVQDVTVAANAN